MDGRAAKVGGDGVCRGLVAPGVLQGPDVLEPRGKATRPSETFLGTEL